MKRRIIMTVAVIVGVIVFVVALNSYSKNERINSSRKWGEILKSYADKADSATEDLYAVGNTVNITMPEYLQVKDFYMLQGENETSAEIMADKEIKEYAALYGAALENGYAVTDQEVRDYLDTMREEMKDAENRTDLDAIISAFDSEDEYWEYEFTVYQKQLPIQNYVAFLNEEFNNKESSDSSEKDSQTNWKNYFDTLREELVEKENFQVVGKK